jgi:uroporphyrinogen-III decarboxylase
VDCLSLDEAVDFEVARKVLGPDYCLMGNVSTSLLAFGTPQDVGEATQEVIRKAGQGGPLIVSAGCLVSDLCPPENVRAMINAARDARV